MNKINIKINLKKDCGNLLANADVGITTDDFGVVVMKDFQIWKSPNNNSRLGDFINIRPPSINFYGKWRPRIFFEDEKAWFGLEGQIWYAFQMEDLKKESEPAEIKVTDEIKIPEDMPF
jgi:hypothetical protein